MDSRFFVEERSALKTLLAHLEHLGHQEHQEHQEGAQRN
jgi:hypothetical protein